MTLISSLGVAESCARIRFCIRGRRQPTAAVCHLWAARGRMPRADPAGVRALGAARRKARLLPIPGFAFAACVGCGCPAFRAALHGAWPILAVAQASEHETDLNMLSVW